MTLPFLGVAFAGIDAFLRPGDDLDISRWLALQNMLANGLFAGDNLAFLDTLATGSTLNRHKYALFRLWTCGKNCTTKSKKQTQENNI